MRNEASSNRGSDDAVKARPMNAAEGGRATNTRAETIRCYTRIGLLHRSAGCLRGRYPLDWIGDGIGEVEAGKAGG